MKVNNQFSLKFGKMKKFMFFVKILRLVERMANQSNSYKEDNFSKYCIVWSKSQEAFINEFVTKGERKSEPNKQADVSVPLSPLLEQFEKQISIYRDSKIPDSRSFGWLRTKVQYVWDIEMVYYRLIDLIVKNLLIYQ
jgi:hypothetical protein